MQLTLRQARRNGAGITYTPISLATLSLLHPPLLTPPPPPIPFHPRYSSAPATLHPMRKRAKGTQRKGIPFLPPDRAPLAPPANFYFVYRAEHAISPMYFHRSL